MSQAFERWGVSSRHKNLPLCREALTCLASSIGISIVDSSSIEILKSLRDFATDHHRPTLADEKGCMFVSVEEFENVSPSSPKLRLMARIVNNRILKWKKTPLISAVKHIAWFETLIRDGDVEKVARTLLEVRPMSLLSEAVVSIGKTNESPFSFDAAMVLEALFVMSKGNRCTTGTAAAESASSAFFGKNEITTDEMIKIAKTTALQIIFCSSVSDYLVTSLFDDGGDGVISSSREDEAAAAAPMSERLIISSSHRQQLLSKAISELSPCGVVLSEMSKTVKSPKSSIFRLFFSPRTNIDAIAVGALVFDIDFSKAAYPLAEYYKAFFDRFCFYNYEPLFPNGSYSGEGLSLCTSEHSIRSAWNPLFNPFYTPSEIETFVKREGFGLKIINKKLVISCEDFPASSSETFSEVHPSAFPTLEDALVHSRKGNMIMCLGVHSTSKNKKSPYSLDLVNSVNPENVITIGSSNFAPTAFLISDIVDAFRTHGAFIVSSELCVRYVLSKREVNKMRILALDTPASSASSLVEIIDELRVKNMRLDMRTIALRDLVNKCEQNAAQARRVFKSLTDASMFMRGWKVTSDEYPLAERDTTVADDDDVVVMSHQIDHNVTLAILAYDDSLEAVSSTDLRFMLKNSPLLQRSTSSLFEAGHHQREQRDEPPSFMTVVGEMQGYTISDRINILRLGNEGPTASCLRTSSNVLAASVYYYSVAVGFAPPFDIRRLDDIT